MERLWWAIEKSTATICLARSSFSYLAGRPCSYINGGIVEKLPMRRWTNTVTVGFTRSRFHTSTVKVAEEVIAIPLRDFGDTSEAQNVVGIPFNYGCEPVETTHVARYANSWSKSVVNRVMLGFLGRRYI